MDEFIDQLLTEDLVCDIALPTLPKRLNMEDLGQLQPRVSALEDEFNSDEDLARKAGDIGTTIFHPVGTAKMGQDKDAVVDDRLRVHGIDGLRVIDASIMPTITSGNTNSPTVMIAEKGAEMIIQDAKAT